LSEKNKPVKSLDCIGLYCPEPLFQTREQIDFIEVGEILEVLSDDPAADEDLRRFVKRAGHTMVKFEKKDNILHFLIKREK